MKKRLPLSIVATLVLMVATALVAQAQANRTFVNGNAGTDAGNCPKTTPCKTLNYAHGVTNIGGEIVVIESDGVGQLTITKSITVMADPGHTAFIKAQPGTAGITVSPGAGIAVVLRNLQLGGQGGASTTGVQQTSGKLVIENCVFQFLTTGLLVTAGDANVQDSSFSFNTTAVRAEGQGPDQDPSVNGVIPRVTIVRLSGGLIADNGTAFQMHNVAINGLGVKQNGSCNAQNIFVRTFGGSNDPLTNIVGNTTFLTETGTSESGFCGAGNDAIGRYSSQQSGQTTAASQ